ncbi:hypothetical protein [Candidatus Parabeggiatoa sp. HSG14]|uniref:hypothetical protein n=1 Tax=Candidatus Parabeggiatoa sp. HSG14 TaxID=3055593 RepID=UPI0025A92851|nr:hypothetical protein [Thiotrichales bacterium HSG14]
MKPFRWNIRKKEQLGSLLDITAEEAYDDYEDHLAECASKVVARSGGRKLIFVGRSPENIFDYLSGVFENTNHESQIDILNISNRFMDIDNIRKELPLSYKALKDHFMVLGIAPNQIVLNTKGICFCDLVYWGGTFEKLFEFIQKWSIEERSDFPSIINKTSFIGITQRTKNNPNTWRWQQNADWVKNHNKLRVKNISIPERLWDYLGNQQVKVAKTNYPERWGGKEVMLPPREEGNIKALKQAYEIYCQGVKQKVLFAERLASNQEFKEPWLRSLVNELKKIAF